MAEELTFKDNHRLEPAVANRLQLSGRLGWFSMSTVLDDFSRYILA